MDKRNEIFERMHEKMTPSREAEAGLFARADQLSGEEDTPSAAETGGIIMSRTIKDNTHETELNTVRSRRGGIIAAAAAIALVIGIGGYAAFGRGALDTDDTPLPAAGSSSEEAHHLVAHGTVPATDDMDVPGMTGEQALEKAAKLLGIPISAISADERKTITDHGIETYSFTAVCNGMNKVTLTVPTGLITETDETEDPFMTETAAGQALTDAGIAHDGFDAMASYEYTAKYDNKDHSGWRILFTAGDSRYSYFIDDTGSIVEKHVTSLNRALHETTEEEAKEMVNQFLNVNYKAPAMTDFQSSEKETDSGVECYVFKCRAMLSSGDYSTAYVPDGTLSAFDGDDTFMTETAAGMALSDAGFGHRDFDLLTVTPSVFMTEDNRSLEGFRVAFIADGTYYFTSIDSDGKIVSRSILSEEEQNRLPGREYNYDEDTKVTTVTAITPEDTSSAESSQSLNMPAEKDGKLTEEEALELALYVAGVPREYVEYESHTIEQYEVECYLFSINTASSRYEVVVPTGDASKDREPDKLIDNSLEGPVPQGTGVKVSEVRAFAWTMGEKQVADPDTGGVKTVKVCNTSLLCKGQNYVDIIDVDVQ